MTHGEVCTCARSSGPNVESFGTRVTADTEFASLPLYQAFQQCSSMAVSAMHIQPERRILAWIVDQTKGQSCQDRCLASPDCAGKERVIVGLLTMW